MDRKELIEQNLGLVHACANRFRGRGIEYEELYSAGCLGLVKAADGFREELGFAFSTYAVPAVLGEIKRLFRDGGAVKVSRSLKERSREAVKLSEKLTKENGREPTVTELSKILGIDCFAVSELLNISLPPVSLTASDDDNERQTDVPVPSGEDAIQDKLALEEVLKRPNPYNAQIFQGTYAKCDSRKARNVTGTGFKKGESRACDYAKKADG